MSGFNQPFPRLNRQRPLAEGLANAWPMYEGGGEVAHDVGERGVDAVLTNMEPNTDWIGSPYGSALDFGGTDEYLDLPTLSSIWDSGNYADDANHFTISFWIKTSTADNTLVVPYGYLAPSGSPRPLIQISLERSSTNKLEFYLARDINSGIRMWASTTTQVNDGVWHHICCVKGGNAVADCRIYIDGISQSLTTQTDALTAGAFTELSSMFPARNNNGTVSLAVVCEAMDLWIWSRALTREEVVLRCSRLDRTFASSPLTFLGAGAAPPASTPSNLTLLGVG